MNYDIEKLTSIFTSSVQQLQLDQPILFDEKQNVGERAISSALSFLISASFPSFNVNCEYNRMTDEHGQQIPKRIHLDPNVEDPRCVYPDIIIHHQTDDRHNLVIVEIKMHWKNREKYADFAKLRQYTKELKYKFGLYLELSDQGISEMTWFQNGEQI